MAFRKLRNFRRSALPRGDPEEALERARIGQQCRAGAFMHDAAAFEDQRAVGDGQDLLRMLLDDDGRQPLVAEQPRQCRAAVPRTMIGARPSVGSSSSSSRGLITSARPIASICCSPPDSVPPGLRRRSFEAREHPYTRSRRPRSGPRHGGEVLLHGQRPEDVALLRHPADAGAARVSRRQRADARGRPSAIDAGEAARDADQGVDQRGLADAVAAQQASASPSPRRNATSDSTTAPP